MNDRHEPASDLLAGLRDPDPPVELRDRVLLAARQAVLESPPSDRWTLLWESRTFRAAWGLSVLALAVCNLALPVGQRGAAGGRGASASLVTRGAEAELVDLASLPRLDMNAAPRRPSGQAPPEGKEEQS